MSAARENERAAALLERLLTDPLLRADFRRRPATTCRAFELDDLADELETGTRGTATIEQRESRSGMAGVMVAAAVEGVGLGELLARHAVEAAGDAAEAAARLIDHVTGASGAPPIAEGSQAEAAEPAQAQAGAAAEPATEAAGPAAAPPGQAAPPAATVLASNVAPADPAASTAAASAAPPYPGAEPSGLPPAEATPPGVALPTAPAMPSALPPATPAGAASAVPATPAGAASAPTAPSTSAASALPPAPASSEQVLASAPAGAAAPPAGTMAAAASHAPAEPSGLPSAAPARPAPQAPPGGSPATPATAVEHGGIVATRNHAREIAPESLEMSGKTADGGYPGDRASKTQLASWMARKAAAAGLPPELPVMAALVESGLANLNHGDRDSVGFFQMRLGIWNRGAYRGYPDNAELQLKWFIDQATALKAARVGAGARDFGKDPSTWGTWIADVERPDERYRYRYQEQLGAARELVRGSEGRSLAARSSSAEPAGGGSPVSTATLAANAREVDPGGTGAATSSSGERAVKLAKQYLGRPYVWGGESPASGFDCSGLVQYVYGQIGVELPRVTHQQFEVGKVVGRQGLQTGDIVFFRDSSGYIHHEGLYLDDGRFLHAPRTGDVIKISSLDEPYFAEQFAGGRRVGENAVPAAPDIDLTRRSAGRIATTRVHDARVMPVLDPSAPRPAG